MYEGGGYMKPTESLGRIAHEETDTPIKKWHAIDALNDNQSDTRKNKRISFDSECDLDNAIKNQGPG